MPKKKEKVNLAIIGEYNKTSKLIIENIKIENGRKLDQLRTMP